MTVEPTAGELAVADLEATAYPEPDAQTMLLLVLETAQEHLHAVPDNPPLEHEAMGALLAALDSLKQDVSAAQDHIAALLGDTWPGGPLLGDGWLIEPRKSASRTQWRNDELWDALRPRIVRRVLDPAGTGERVGDEATAARTIDVLRELANVSGSAMRVGALRSYEIDPDEWSKADYRWVCSVRRTETP